MKPPAGSILIPIDLQRAIEDARMGPRNNPEAEQVVARLLAHWRAMGWPIWHVRHDSTDRNSSYRPGQPGNDFKPEVAPLPNEPVIAKRTNSAFIGTDLSARLEAAGRPALVFVGVATNNSVEATVRMAGNLGFESFLVADACIAFARTDWNGAPRSAEEVHAMSLANLDREYCTVVQSDALLA